MAHRPAVACADDLHCRPACSQRFLRQPSAADRGLIGRRPAVHRATFYVDPGWVLNDAIPVTNPNIFVFGKPGRGKSAWVKRSSTACCVRLPGPDLGSETKYELMCVLRRRTLLQPSIHRLNPSTRTSRHKLGPARQGGAAPQAGDHLRTLARPPPVLIGSQSIGDRKVAVGPTEEQVLKAVLVEVPAHATDTASCGRLSILRCGSSCALTQRPPDRGAAIPGPAHVPRRHPPVAGRGRATHLRCVRRDLRRPHHRHHRLDCADPIPARCRRLMPLGDDAVGMALMSLVGTAAASRVVGAGSMSATKSGDSCASVPVPCPPSTRIFGCRGRMGILRSPTPSNPQGYLGAGHAGSQAQQIAKDLLHLGDIKVLFGQDAEVADDLGSFLGLGPVARDIVTGWAMGSKARALIAVGRLHRSRSPSTPTSNCPDRHQPETADLMKRARHCGADGARSRSGVRRRLADPGAATQTVSAVADRPATP